MKRNDIYVAYGNSEGYNIHPDDALGSGQQLSQSDGNIKNGDFSVVQDSLSSGLGSGWGGGWSGGGDWGGGGGGSSSGSCNFTAKDRLKFDSMYQGAEPNQDAFSYINTDSGTAYAKSNTDQVTITGDDGVKVTAVDDNTVVISGDKSERPYVIKTTDQTEPTDDNLFSALRSLQLFIRKDAPDSTNHLVDFLDGIGVGVDYSIDKDGNAILHSVHAREGEIRSIKSNDIETVKIDGKDATLDNVVSKSVVSESGKIDQLTSVDIITQTITGDTAVLDDVTSLKTKSNLGTIDLLFSTNIKTDTIKGDSAEFSKGDIEVLKSTDGTIVNLKSTKGEIKDLTSIDIHTTNIDGLDLEFKRGSIETITSSLGDITNIVSKDGLIDELQSVLINTDGIVGEVAKFDSTATQVLTAVDGTITSLESDEILVGDIKGETARFDTVDTDYISALKGLILELKSTLINTDKLNAVAAIIDDTKTDTLTVTDLAKIMNLDVEKVAKLTDVVLRNYISSPNFVSGFLGEGFRLYKNEDDLWNMELDNLIVRKVFLVFEIVVLKITYQGGMILRSAAGGTITEVEDLGDSWKCTHDGMDDFVEGDQVICQNFKVIGEGARVKRYWRLAVDAGQGFVTLSKEDCEKGSSEPEIGDDIVHLGNRTNKNRQHAQLISVVGEDAPYRDDYSGINSYSTVGKLIQRSGRLTGIIDSEFGPLQGTGLYSLNVYLKGLFRLLNNKTVEEAILDSYDKSSTNIDNVNKLLQQNIDNAKGQLLESIDGVLGDLSKLITDVKQDFIIAEGAINSNITETNKILEESKTTSGEIKQQLKETLVNINSLEITAGKFESTLGSITEKQGEIDKSISSVKLTADGLKASVDGFKETESEIKETAAKIEATHEGIVLEASEKSAKKAIDDLLIGARNLIRFSKMVEVGESGKMFDLTDHIKSGESVTVLFNAQSKSSNSQTGYLVRYYGKDKKLILSSTVDGPNGDMVTTVLSKGDIYHISIYPSKNATTGHSALLRNVKVERGVKATHWTEAPEDVVAGFESRIEETESRFEVKEGQISSTVKNLEGKITDVQNMSDDVKQIVLDAEDIKDLSLKDLELAKQDLKDALAIAENNSELTGLAKLDAEKAVLDAQEEVSQAEQRAKEAEALAIKAKQDADRAAAAKNEVELLKTSIDQTADSVSIKAELVTSNLESSILASNEAKALAEKAKKDAKNASTNAALAQNNANDAAAKAAEADLRAKDALLASGESSAQYLKAKEEAEKANAEALKAASDAKKANSEAVKALLESLKATDEANRAEKALADVTSKYTEILSTADQVKISATLVSKDVETSNLNVINSRKEADKAKADALNAKDKADEAAKKAAEALTSSGQSSQAYKDALAQANKAAQDAIKAKENADKANADVLRAIDSASRAEKAEASINVKADEIVMLASKKSAEKAIDDLKIGGRNLVLDSKGEMSFTNSIYQHPLDVNVFKECIGEKLTISFYAKAAQSGQTMDVYLRNVANASIISGTRLNPFEVATEYTKYNYTISLADISSVTSLSLAFRSIRSAGGTVRGRVDLKHLQIEKGNKPTDWTPAPEDIEDRLSETEARFEIKENQIAQSVKDVLTVGNQVLTKYTEIISTADEIKSVAKGVDDTSTSITQTAGLISALAKQVSADVEKSKANAADALSNANKALTNAASAQEKANEADAKAKEAALKASDALASAGQSSQSYKDALALAKLAKEKADLAKLDAANAKALADLAKLNADKSNLALLDITVKESSINATAEKITALVIEVSGSALDALEASQKAKADSENANKKALEAAKKAKEALESSGLSSAEYEKAKAQALKASQDAANAKKEADKANLALKDIGVKLTSIESTAELVNINAQKALSSANKAIEAESNINIKAEGIVMQASQKAADKAIDDLEIGVRNFVLNSDYIVTEKNGYGGKLFNLSEHFIKILKSGELVGRYINISCDLFMNGVEWSDASGFKRFFFEIALEYDNGSTIYRNVACSEPDYDGRISRDFIVTDKVVRVEFCKAAFQNPSKGKMSASNFQIKIGNKATDWTPAPEDFATAEETKAEFKVMSDRIESNVKSINDSSQKISSAETKIKLNSDNINLKASKTDVDKLTGRVTSAETNITQNSKLISLTSDSVKNLLSGAANLSSRLDVAESGIKASVKQTDYNKDKLETNSKISQIEQDASNIKLSVSDHDKRIKGVDDRVKTAEIALKPDNIWLSVKGPTERAIDDLQVGERNYFSIKKINSIKPSQWVALARIYDFYLAPNSSYTISTNLPEGQNVAYLNGSLLLHRLFFDGLSLTDKTDSNGHIFLAICVGREYYNDILNGKYWIKLERGKSSTEWSPAPEDVDAQLLDLEKTTNANLGVMSDKIEANVKSIQETSKTVSQHSTKILQNSDSIALKASKSDLDKLTGRVSTSESKIEQNSKSISLNVSETNKVKQDLDSLEIGGRNLFQFKRDYTPGIFIRSNDNSLAYEAGAKSLSINISGLKTISIFIHDNNGAKYERMAFSIYEKVESGQAPKKIIHKRLDNPVQTSFKYENISVPENGNFLVLLYGSGASDKDSYPKLLKVESGSKSTDWTPAPEDMSTKEDYLELSGLLDVTKNEIKGLVKKTDYDSNNNKVNQLIGLISTKYDNINLQVSNQGKSIDGLTNRVSLAEIDLKPDKIWLKVKDLTQGIVDNLEIGGRNLLTKSGGSDISEARFWIMSAYNYVSIEEDNLAKYTIHKSSGAGRLERVLDLDSGNYTVSIWLKGDLNIDYNSFVGARVLNQYKDRDGDYIIFRAYFEVPVSTQVRIRAYYGNGLKEGDEFFAKYFKLEKGNKATDWTPAPEDMASQADISNVNSEIELTKKDINLRVLTSTYNTDKGKIVNDISAITVEQGKISQRVTDNSNGIKNVLLEMTPDKIWSKVSSSAKTQSDKSAKEAIDSLDINIGNYWAISKKPWHQYIEHEGNGVFSNTATSSAFAIWSMKKTGINVGSIYTASFDIMSLVDGISFLSSLFYVNGQSPSSSHNLPKISKGEWVTVYSTFNYTVENNDLVHIYIKGLKNNRDILFKNFKIEKGGKYTGWIPAPEDLTPIGEFETYVEQTNKSIGLHAKDIQANKEGLLKVLPDKIWIAIKGDAKTQADSSAQASSTALKNEIISGFAVTTSGISMLGKTISLAGKVLFSSLALDALQKINQANTNANNALSNIEKVKGEIPKKNYLYHEGGNYILSKDFPRNIDKKVTVSLWGDFSKFTSSTSFVEIAVYGDIDHMITGCKYKKISNNNVVFEGGKLNVNGADPDDELIFGFVTIEPYKIQSAKLEINDTPTNWAPSPEDKISMAKLDSTIIDGGYIKTSLIDTDRIVAKHVLTNITGPRIQMTGSEMTVYGIGEKPNIIFGVDLDGYAVLKYYSHDGRYLYDLGPKGINWNNIEPSRWNTLEYYRVTTKKGPSQILWDDVSKVMKMSDSMNTDYYKWYAGSNPTISEGDREKEKIIRTSPQHNAGKIPDGWYVVARSYNPGERPVFFSMNLGEYVKPKEKAFYPDKSGVFDGVSANIYYEIIYQMIDGVITDEYYVMWNGDRNGNQIWP